MPRNADEFMLEIFEALRSYNKQGENQITSVDNFSKELLARIVQDILNMISEGDYPEWQVLKAWTDVTFMPGEISEVLVDGSNLNLSPAEYDFYGFLQSPFEVTLKMSDDDNEVMLVVRNNSDDKVTIKAGQVIGIINKFADLNDGVGKKYCFNIRSKSHQ